MSPSKNTGTRILFSAANARTVMWGRIWREKVGTAEGKGHSGPSTSSVHPVLLTQIPVFFLPAFPENISGPTQPSAAHSSFSFPGP